MIIGKNKQKCKNPRADPKKWPWLQKYQKSLKVFLAFAVLALVIQGKEWGQKQENSLVLPRKEAGGGESVEAFRLEVPELEAETEYTVTIPEQILAGTEKEQLFEEAEREIEQSFCGVNASMEHITEKVVLKKELADGLISAEWRFDDYDVMNPDGSIQEENVAPEGSMVTATVEMTYGEESRLYEFPFCVYPREKTPLESVYAELKLYFQDHENRAGEAEMVLPDKAAGYELAWEEKRSHTAFIFLVLGAIAAVLVELGEKQKEADRHKEREKELLSDYPEIVNKLSLLLGAGMTVSMAWERIITMYEKQKEAGIQTERPAYEEMRQTFREIKDGMGERTAYEQFGERCGLRPYRKLSALIVQNLRKGAKGMTALMTAEADEAFELRKNLAKKLGEEAGTKLLAPMLMMLGVIVVILMVPAFLSFKS